MDFFSKLLGRPPASPPPGLPPLHSWRDWPPLPTRQVDQYVPHGNIEDEIRRLLKCTDRQQVALGNRLLQQVYGDKAKTALAALRRALGGDDQVNEALVAMNLSGKDEELRQALASAGVGQAVTALTDLVNAEQKRVRILQRSALFAAPNAEGAMLARLLLYRLSDSYPVGSTYLPPKVRTVLSAALNDSPRTLAALRALTLGALSNDKTHDVRVLRWCMTELAQRMEPAHDVGHLDAPDAWRAAAADLLAPTLGTDCNGAMARATAAWEKKDIPGTLNALTPMATLATIQGDAVRTKLIDAAGDAWKAATRLAHRILHVQTLTDEGMECFRMSSQHNAGWSSVLPLLEPLDDGDVNALEHLHHYVQACVITERWSAAKGKALLRVLVKLLEDHGYGARKCASDVRKTLAYSKPLPPGPEAEPSDYDWRSLDFS